MIAAILACGLAAVPAAFWWLRRRYAVVTVRGESMRPTYQPGDRLLVRRTRSIRRGDCVVFTDTQRQVPGGWIVKRAVGVPGDADVPDGQMLVLGDNPGQSYDSRHFGYLDTDRVRGVVLRHLRA